MIRTLPLALMLFLPGMAAAHGLHDEGTFMAGAAHPVGGLDHVLAMVAVGLLAAQMGGRALWGLPAGFVAAMVLGGGLGAFGVPFPAVEPMILASIVVLGVAVALAVRLPAGVVLPAVALFGAAHGWAHGAEGPQTGLALYALGFATMTGLLHVAGIGLGRALNALALRALGGAAAVAGLALTVG